MIFDKLILKIPQNQNFGTEENKLYIKISPTGSTLKNITKTYDSDDSNSILKNGLREFTYNAATFVSEENTAAAIAQEINSEYNVGKKFVEAEWTGNPKLQPGMAFAVREPRRADKTNDTSQLTQSEKEYYIALSNEISLSNGLRFKTKARQCDYESEEQ